MPVAIPVLMYHHINPNRGDTVTVTPENFAAQMHYLAAAGYRTLSLHELLQHVSGLRPATEKGVVLTFDDGWLDNYLYAIPELERLGFKAAFFVVTARVDAASGRSYRAGKGFPCHAEAKRLIQTGRAEQVVLDWGTIIKLAQGGLFEFHSHTVTHRRAADLDHQELAMEIQQSRQLLELKLGRPAPYLCWPYGSFSAAAVRLAREAGYEALFTTVDGSVVRGADRFQLPRIEVRDDLAWFREMLTAIPA